MKSVQLNQALCLCEIFSGTADPAEKVRGISETVRFQRGEPILTVSEGELRAGIILKGSAKVTKKTESGHSLPMTTLTPGRLFGIAGMFGGDGSGIYEIVAAQSTDVLFMTESGLRQLIRENPDVAMNLIAYLTQRIRFLNSKIDSFTAGNTEMKLLMFLTDLADNDGCVKLPFSVSEGARRLDMGRASFYRALDSLEQSGTITRTDGVIRLCSSSPAAREV